MVIRQSQVRKLVFIGFFNVTSANVVHFLPNFLHVIRQVYGTMVVNFIMT